jgi:hypothetical protein
MNIEYYECLGTDLTSVLSYHFRQVLGLLWALEI